MRVGVYNTLEIWPNPKSGSRPDPCQASLVLMFGSASRTGSLAALNPEVLPQKVHMINPSNPGQSTARMPVARQSRAGKKKGTTEQSDGEISVGNR